MYEEEKTVRMEDEREKAKKKSNEERIINRKGWI